MYKVTILADSISPKGVRLTTMEVTYPRIIHSEMMTHRVFSRNSASSRAIPTVKMAKSVADQPFIPTYWGQNQSGMQATRELKGWRRWAAKAVWKTLVRFNTLGASLLGRLGLHKQLANRPLEAYAWHTVIITSTEWDNFFALRCHPDAQPEIRTIAEMMAAAMELSTPKHLLYGEWHMPLVPDYHDLLDQGYQLSEVRKISAGRCARVSYLTHDGKRDPQADIALCERLVSSGHMSPLEHVATPARSNEFIGNLSGWWSLRKEVPGEAVFRGS